MTKFLSKAKTFSVEKGKRLSGQSTIGHSLIVLPFLELTFHLFLGLDLALVILFLAFGQSDLQFDMRFFEIEGQGDDGHAPRLYPVLDEKEFLAVEEQLALPIFLVIVHISMLVGRDRNIVGPGFVGLIDGDMGIGQGGLPLPQGFDLCPLENQAGLEFF